MSLPVSDPAIQRPEEELLCCCARTHWSPALRGRVQELVRRGLDWEAVLYLARLHRLRPLLHNTLSEMEIEGVPEDVVERLRRNHQGLLLQSLFGARELVRMMGLFSEHGIEALAFKGPLLGERVYGDLGLRPFGDLDLLLHRSDLLRAKTLLCAEGYRPHPVMNEAEEQAYLDEQFGYGFLPDGVGLAFELHWALAHRRFGYRADVGGVWARAQAETLGGAAVRTLGLEDLLVFLCMHGAKHMWHQLILVVDIAELFRACPELQVDRVLALAREAQCERILGLGLHLAHRLLQAPIPAGLLAAVGSSAGVERLGDEVIERAFSRPGSSVRFVEEVSFHVRTRETWRERARALGRGALLAVAPSDEDQAFVRLPPRWRFLYYAVRPFRIARAEWRGEARGPT